MVEEKKNFILKEGQTDPESHPADDEQASESRDSQKSQSAQLPKITFSTFILSLNASALVNLGVIQDPATGSKTRNLALGKQTIDILVMLEAKTRGNLTTEEENMLKHILYDLRINYVRQKE
jgi:hypothetical protein